MIKARAGVIVCFGLFSIAAQTLLFREYLTAFEGHDIGIGCFFGAWFIWITVAALLVSKVPGLVRHLVQFTELLLLAYVPAFCLQYALLVFFRDLAGVESYAFLSFQQILGGTLLVTAPVSLLTGLLFPALCRWIEGQESLPVGRVYVLEAAGSLLGGLGVTALYYYGASTAFIFMALVTLICAGAAWSSWLPSPEQSRWFKRLLTLACLLLCLLAWTQRVDTLVAKRVQRHKWQRLLPTGTLQGGFVTPQAEYLYGRYQDQWVVMREGSVCETLGAQVEAGRLAAMTLCQNVAAEKVLVLGEGLALCRCFLKSAHVTAVDWFHPDPHYLPALRARIPEAFQVPDERLHWRSGEAGDWLALHPETYDIVLINLPDTTNAVFSRFMTRQFLAQVKQSLGYGGLVALGFAGGENVQGEELAYLGASLRQTLATQFSQTVLVPGERSYFLSANLPYLDDSPAVLQRRFQALENAAAVYPPAALSTLYRPERAAEILAIYDQVAGPRESLVNDYSRPVPYLYQLLFLAKQSGRSLLEPVHTIVRCGPGLLLIPVILLALVRAVYVARTVSQRRRPDHTASLTGSQVDVTLMVGCAGLVGISTVIIVMYVFQMHYGSLYLHVGMISALFMVGLTLGGFGFKRAVAWVDTHRARGAGVVLTLCLVLVLFHGVCLAAMGVCIPLHLPPWGFALFLLLGGLCCGGYVPLGARLLQDARLDTASAACLIEGADHLGAALGGCLASLLLIPLFGPQTALCVMVVLILANLVLLGSLYYRCVCRGPRVYAHPVLTPVGYALSALAVCVVVGSYMVTQAQAASGLAPDAPYAPAWVAGRQITEKTASLADGSVNLPYYEVHEGTQLKGYVLDSAIWSAPVYGYGGPMAVVAFVEPNGVLIDFKVARSHETPGYLEWLQGWMQSLCGDKLFGSAALKEVDSVSGATLSSQAIITLLGNSGQRFSQTVLGPGILPEPKGTPQVKTVDWQLLSWAAALVLALGAIYHGRLWSRVLVLGYVLAVSGFWLNRQYALDQILRLLQGEGLLSVPLASLCLLLGVPLLALFCGNLYCGYLCPFGALQELLSLIVPKRFKPKLCLRSVTWSRFIKYLLLFLLVLAFFIRRETGVPGLDPLVSFFNLRFWGPGTLRSRVFIVALVTLLGGLFVTRLWCRYLCPTGAFLSLFNVGAGLQRLFPGKQWGRCEFGLSAHDNLDCICCDRCRLRSGIVPTRAEIVTRTAPGWGAWLLFWVLLCLALALVVPAWQPEPAPGAVATTGDTSPTGLPGEPRDVDMKRLEQMIQQGRLSSQEAQFYRQGPEDVNRP